MKSKQVEEGMLKPITKEQIDKVLEVNSCLTPEHWNKGMFDAFMLGIRLTRLDEREKIEKIMISLAYQKKGDKVVRVNINHLDVMKRLR